MRNLLAIFLVLSLCIFIGCLGMSGSTVGTGGVPITDQNLLITGRAYFADRQLYGNIPVAAISQTGEKAGTILTDSAGYFAFSDLPSGVYDLVAMTGESEVIFARGVQVDGISLKQLDPVALLGITKVIVNEITHDSFKLSFRSNRFARASVEYGPVGGLQDIVTIGQAGAILHEITIDGLLPLTDYEITIYLTGDDGQDFVMRGLYAATTSTTGPTDLSVSINEGAYDTKTQNVTLYLNAENASQMRISEYYDLADALWVNYSETYDFSFSNTSDGTKRVYVQFRDENQITSSVQSDAILMTVSGFLGVWINDGDAVTNNPEVIIKTVFPGATQMQISDNSDFLNSFWEAYTEAKKWRFSDEDGLKTVYCKFRGGAADAEEIFSSSIILDSTPPEVTIKINDGSTVTATTSVVLDFNFSTPPSKMIVSNELATGTDSNWVSFSTPLDWELTSGDGEKTVYAVFRDSAGNQYGPVSQVIELDTVAPTGNSFAIKQTDDVASEEIDFALTASMPVFLHFDAADESTYRAFYSITIATTTPPVAFSTVEIPFTPVDLYDDQLPVGSHRVWVKYGDEAGNEGFLQSKKITIDGPQIIISPEAATLLSGQEQQFSYSIKNIEMADVGSIRWRVISGSGTIDNDGLFTAPAPIYSSSEAIVRAEATEISNLNSHVSVQLATSVEMLFQQRDGRFTYDAIDDQVAPGQSFDVAIKILHSNQAFEIFELPTAGTTSISSPVQGEYGTIATLTFSAPAVAPADNTVTIGVRSLENQSVTGTIQFIISTGPNLILTPTSGLAQRGNPLDISATVTGTASTTMTWSLSPSNLGSFDPDDENVVVTTTDAPNHFVTFYASMPAQIKQASVTVTIDGATKKSNISVYPPLRFQVSPIATSALPIITPITFKAQSFDYLLGTASETVVWEFKNAARPDFMPADGKTYIDRGSLTIIDDTTAEFRRPTKLPSESDTTAADYVLIRATSVSDSIASVTAVATITPKVVVEIFDSIEKIASITTAATVAEVGKLQFFAGVTPSVIGNTSVNWTVNGVTESEQYGNIDTNGLYTAPDEIFVNEVTVRASSNYDPTAYASVVVSLSEFWLPKRQNMFDSVTGEVMPITSLLVNPYTAVGDDFILYAGTRGYGVWKATFSDEPGDTTGGDWQPVSGLSANQYNSQGAFTVGHLVISPEENVYAATASGIWYIPDAGAAERITMNDPALHLPAENYLKLAFNNSDSKYLFATTPGGVYRLTLQDAQTCSGVLKVLITTEHYKDNQLESRTDSTASPPVNIDAYSNVYNPNPIGGILNTIAYDDYNDRLYAGGEGGIFLYMNNTDVPNLISISANAFVADAPSVTTAFITFFILSTNQPKQYTISATDPPLDIALDVVNRNTLWAATVGGVYRSVDNGANWSASAFGVGSTVNTRAIIVDSTNTINVMAGSEDGLYRSTNAGGSWKRIRSGLGNHKTITCLTQAAGLAGARRKVWVGTAGGVFMGKQSLDLE